MDYIRIESIGDINPDQISIRDLNKRYIDASGNRYRARFNLNTRKIEFVRLALNREEAERVRAEILRERTEQRKKRAPHAKEGSVVGIEMSPAEPGESWASSEDLWQDAVQGEVRQNGEENPYDQELIHLDSSKDEVREDTLNLDYFDEEEFVKGSIADLQKVKNRQSAIINFLKKTNLYEGFLKNSIDDIQRHMDIDCWQRAESTVNFHRELITYPRPLSFYLSKLPEKRRRVLEKIADDFDRMKMVQRWELQEELEGTYRKILEITQRVDTLLKENASETYMNTITAHHRKLISDAKTGCDILIEECKTRLGMMEKWIDKFP